MSHCGCCLCQAREQNKHPWEIYFTGRREADFVRTFPDHPIYCYEAAALAEAIGWKIESSDDVKMAGLCYGSIYSEYENRKKKGTLCQSNSERKQSV